MDTSKLVKELIESIKEANEKGFVTLKKDIKLIRHKKSGEIRDYKSIYEYYHTLVIDPCTGDLYALYDNPSSHGYHSLCGWEIVFE